VRFIIIILLSFWCSQLFAAAAPKVKKPNPWKGTDMGAGYVANTGNSTSKNANASVNVKYTIKPWVYSNTTTWGYAGSNAKGETANRFYTQFQARYYVTEHSFLYGLANYTKDHFNGYDYIYSESVGYGYRIAMPKTMTWDVYAGPDARQARSTSTQDKQTALGVLVGSGYVWAFTKGNKLKVGLLSNINKDNAHTVAKIALITTVYKSLALQLGYQWRHDSKPQSAKSHVNTITTLQLVYNF
jgi:putative salt-induced outer membrane protein